MKPGAIENTMENKAKPFISQLDSDKIENRAHDIQENVRDAVHYAQDRASDLWKRANVVMKENPTYVIAGAAVLGLAFGFFLARRRSY